MYFSNTDSGASDESESDVWESDEADNDATQSTSEPEEPEIPVAPKKTPAAAKPKPRQPAKRKSVAEIENDSEDDVAKSRSASKRSRRSSQKPNKLKDYNENSEESDEEEEEILSSSSDEDDDDQDTDFKSPGKKMNRKKAPIKKKVVNTKKKTISKRKSNRQSTDEEEAPVKPLTNGTKSNRSSSSRRSRRVDDDNDNLLLLDTVSCYDLLSALAKHDDVWPFDRPVNKVDVPDYYKVIQHPMDLAKVKSKLNLGEYSSNYDFMNDIQLIFRNCDLYNNSGSPIYR